MNSFYDEEELKLLGLKKYGSDVKISRKASIYDAEQISIGSHVRIDDFCILSGQIVLGSYIHIAAYSALYAGDAGIEVADFSNISSKVVIYAVSDDYTGETMTNPMVPDEFKNVQKEKVTIAKHVIIGSGCTVLPGVELKEGSAFGSMSLIKESSEEWSINVGIPSREIKKRERGLLRMEEKLIQRKTIRGGVKPEFNFKPLPCRFEGKKVACA